MGNNVHTLLLQILDLILRLRDDNGDVGLFHVVDLLGEEHEFLSLQAGPFFFQFVKVRIPVFFHLVVHLHGSCLVDRDNHCLPLESPAHEMRNDILCNPLQPVVAGDEMVLLTKVPFKFLLLFGIELCIPDECLHLLVEF